MAHPLKFAKKRNRFAQNASRNEDNNSDACEKTVRKIYAARECASPFATDNHGFYQYAVHKQGRGVFCAAVQL